MPNRQRRKEGNPHPAEKAAAESRMFVVPTEEKEETPTELIEREWSNIGKHRRTEKLFQRYLLIAHLYSAEKANNILHIYPRLQRLYDWRSKYKDLLIAAGTKEGQKAVRRLMDEDEAAVVRLMLSTQITDFEIPQKDIQTTLKLLSPESKRVAEQIQEPEKPEEEVEVAF